MLIFGIKALNRQIKESESKFTSLHTLLNNDDKKYVNRIEFLSQTNLLYNDIYLRFSDRFDKLVNGLDNELDSKFKEINTLFQTKKYNEAKEEINIVKERLFDFEKEVNKLNEDLLQVIAPEIECKKELNDLKEVFDAIKRDYEIHKAELEFLENTYSMIFKHVESLISDIALSIEDANYEDAKASFPELKAVIEELGKTNQAMPELARLAIKEIPQRIGDLKIEYRHIQVDNCPIFHILSDRSISEYEDELNNIIKELKMFVYKDKLERLNALLNTINEKFDLFTKEREDKKAFEASISSVYSSVGETEKSFIRLSNSLPKIRTIYSITDERINQLSSIKKHIEKLGLIKRGVEKLIHANVPQPYSALLSKTNELKLEREEVEKDISEFVGYLSSLKNDVEKAHSSINLYFYRVKEKEKIIRDVAMDFFTNKYKDKISSIYQALDQIHILSLTTPIDVKAINDNMAYLNYEGESTLNQIEQEYNMLKMAEQTIVFSNNSRDKSPNLNVLIEQDEKIFFDGEFEKAYNDATKNIKSYKA